MKYDITNFSTGEISRKFAGRFDLPQYQSGCKTLLNMFPQQTGGAEKRPGTYYADTAAGQCILIPWIKSETEYLILELSAAKIRYYSFDETTWTASLVLSGGSPVETSLSGASWIAAANLKDIKYVQDSVSTLYDTMYFSCPGFTLRKLVRTSDTSWAFTAATLTAYSGTNADACELFEDRLILAETKTFYGSKTASHLDFGVSSPVVATDGFSFKVAAKENTKIKWLAASSSLLFGTASAIYHVAGKEDSLDGTTLAVWPQKQSGIGCNSVQPVMFNNFLVFVQKDGKRIHLIQYSADTEQYETADLTFFADHITGSGIKQIFFQRNPEAVLWAITEDGDLISMTYSAATQTVGWSRHDVDGTVEAGCVIQTSTEDVICLSVLRGTSRLIITSAPRDYGDIEAAHFVDYGVVWDGGAAVTITSITAGDVSTASVVTATSHGFENDELVRIEGITGADIDGEIYTVKDKTTDTFKLYSLDGTNIAYIGTASTGGTASKVTNAVSGLDHLEDEEVVGLGDGSVMAAVTVASGIATFEEYANKIHAGLLFTSQLEPNAISSSVFKDIKKLFIKFLDSVTFKYGTNSTNLTAYIAKVEAPEMGAAPELVTDDIKAVFDSPVSLSPPILIQSDDPLPLTILCLIAEVET